MSSIKRAIGAVFTALYAVLLCAGLLCGVTPVTEAERYLCEWENGAVTEEEEGALAACCTGVSETGDALFLREGVRGRVPLGEELAHAVSVLGGNDFSAIAAYSFGGLPSLARAALDLSFKGRLYYADGFFVWQNGLSAAQTREGEELVVFGEMSVSARKGVTAKRLTLTSTAQVDGLTEHSFSEFRAEPPYEAADGALYLHTAGGKRLVTVCANAGELVLGEYDFADRGALLAAGKLLSADLPFVGSSLSLAGTDADGMFARLFSDGASFRVPETLFRVKVRGGALVSHAFYACPHLAEIEACGLDPSSVAADAFADCRELRLLHVPRDDVLLTGNFSREELPCGCYLYRRVS